MNLELDVSAKRCTDPCGGTRRAADECGVAQIGDSRHPGGRARSVMFAMLGPRARGLSDQYLVPNPSCSYTLLLRGSLAFSI